MTTSLTYRFLLLLSLFFGREDGLCQPSSFVLVGNGPATQQATVVVGSGEAECVRLAVAGLVGDVQKITGRTGRIVTASPGQSYQNAVIVGTVGKSGLVQKCLPDSRLLAGKWEAHRVQSVGGNLVVAGSDERGTMFAVYDFIEQYLGVDPLYFWADREPAKRAELGWRNVSITQTTPTFRYRGWFINDEDLLTGCERTAVFHDEPDGLPRYDLGLGTWLEAVIRAKEAADAGRRTDVTGALQRALAAFDRMQQGQLRNSTGKWQHWYRGDKKNELDCQSAIDGSRADCR